jgi:hypothetical protein
MSGKAMQETVPPAGTAIWKWSNAMEESEGHAFYGLFCYQEKKHFSSQREWEMPQLLRRAISGNKWMRGRELTAFGGDGGEPRRDTGEKWKCRTMHIRCTGTDALALRFGPKATPLAGFGPVRGDGKNGLLCGL